MATTGEKRHMDKVARLECCLCGTEPVELHHGEFITAWGIEHGVRFTAPEWMAE